MTVEYEARFSARKKGAIGQFLDIVPVRFTGEPGLDRSTGFIPAWNALDAAGWEPRVLMTLKELP